MTRAALRAMLVAALLWPALLVAQTLSFTFDDGFDPNANPDSAAQNAQILLALQQAGIRSMLFPAGRFVESAQGMALVRAWGEQGHAIGNHSFAHRNFGSASMSLDAFQGDVLKAEALFKNLPGFQKRLRFPYLKEGESADKRDGMRRWMAGQGYQSGPVSIDTSDWYYAERFVAWRKGRPQPEWQRFADIYIRHLLDRAAYYDTLAWRVTGRRPAHTLLLHTNAINAAFLPQVIQAFRDKGWKIVSAEEAFADPLFRSQPKALPAGESIVWSLAREAGVPGLRYPAEDDTCEERSLRAAGLF